MLLTSKSKAWSSHPSNMLSCNFINKRTIADFALKLRKFRISAMAKSRYEYVKVKPNQMYIQPILLKSFICRILRRRIKLYQILGWWFG